MDEGVHRPTAGSRLLDHADPRVATRSGPRQNARRAAAANDSTWMERILPRQRVDGVLHRVGRQARRVVAVGVNRVERTFELHVERQIDDVVRGLRIGAL